ncbi:redoxin domain-containing protein [Amycolatopsis sp. NPDC051061]|uniref:peroxiredoxin family protein n=1 Tax=Amycolatopsis sp. NPDC051061 TaxID=3155042 RepID=UPI0034200A37
MRCAPGADGRWGRGGRKRSAHGILFAEVDTYGHVDAAGPDNRAIARSPGSRSRPDRHSRKTALLTIGSTTPDLALQDTHGRAVALADYRGSENVLLYFMRSTTCPICNGHVKDLVAPGVAARLTKRSA